MYFSNYVRMDMDSFLRNLFEKDYQYIVLMDRKMYSLFTSYGEEILRKCLNSGRRFICSSSLPCFAKDMKDKNVLIVDDILIHGRTMKKIRNQLYYSTDKPARIDCSVLVIDEQNSEKIVREKEFENLVYRLSLDRWNWRKISRQIINQIRGTLTPLRAAVAYCSWKTDVSEGTLVNDFQLKKLEEYDPDFQKVRTYISEGFLSLPNELGMIEKIVVRFDFSTSIPNTVLVVPQVFLKPLKNTEVEDLFADLLNGLSEQYNLSEISIESICRYFEYCASQWAMQNIKKIFAERYNISENDFVIQDNDLEFCFSSSLASTARKKGFYQMFSKILERNVTKYALDNNPGNIMENILKKGCSLCDQRMYMRYLCECGFADELLDEMKEDARIEGARLDYLVKKHFLQYDSIIYAMMMSISTYNYRSVSGWTTLRVIPGEQAFSYFLFTNKDVFEKTQDLLNKRTNDGTDKEEERERYLVEEFSNIVAGLNINDQLFDIIDSLRTYFHERNRECQINNNACTQLKYIQYMTDIGIPRLLEINKSSITKGAE